MTACACLAAPVVAGESAVGPDTSRQDTSRQQARSTAPIFTLPGQGGASVRLADFRGDVVYVDFWASWCPPCLKSFPWMNALAERHADAGLKVIAISLDADRDDAERFLADTPANFDLAFDPEASSAQAFDVIGMPCCFVIDREGRIAYTHVGFRRKDVAQIELAVAAVLSEPAPAVRQADAGDAGR